MIHTAKPNRTNSQVIGCEREEPIFKKNLARQGDCSIVFYDRLCSNILNSSLL